MSILDPVKDMKGSMLRVQSGLSTGEREAAEMTGSDYEDNLHQLAYENELRESLGLPQSNTAFTTEGGEEDGKVLEGDEQGGG